MACSFSIYHASYPQQVHECSAGPDVWSEVAAWETDQSVCQLAWAHPEYGRVLAGGTTSGIVLLWGQVPDLQPAGGPGAAGGGGEDGYVGSTGGVYYTPLAQLACGAAACRWVRFIATTTGVVRVRDPSNTLTVCAVTVLPWALGECASVPKTGAQPLESLGPLQKAPVALIPTLDTRRPGS